MKTKLLVLTLVVMSFWLSGCSINPTGIDISGKKMSPSKARPAMKQKSSEGLSFFAKTEKATYQLGEPVYMTFRLENNRSEKHRVLSKLDPSIGSVSIVINNQPDKKNLHFIPYTEFDYDASLFTFLQPEQSISSIEPVFFGANGWTFSEPGAYSVHASYAAVNEKGELEVTVAKSIDIEISNSEADSMTLSNEINSASWQAGKYLLWQAGDHLIKGQQLLDSVLNKSPNVMLADYIHSAYAHSYSDHFMDYRNKAVRKADCDRAIEHLSKVGSGISDYVKIQNEMSAIRCASRESDIKQLDKSMQTIDRLSKGKPEYNAIRQRAAELAKVQ